MQDKGKIMKSSISLVCLLVILSGCASVSPQKGPEPASVMPENYASKAVALSLECVDQEVPHSYDRGAYPKAKILHPSFYGCYDWHSAVHGHWAMLRLLDQNPALPERAAIVKKLNRHLSPKNIRGELKYLQKNPLFEWPYGDAWLLRLSQEVAQSSLPEAKAWRKALQPLTDLMVQRFIELLPGEKEAVREGMHDNTAFALTHAWDYAQAAGDKALTELILAKATELFGNDRNCAIESEPGAHDFISPCLVEADLMRRLMPAQEFRAWFQRFLPRIPDSFLQPTIPNNPKDYQESHLIGLLYQKASSMRAVAARLGENDPKRTQLKKAIDRHVQAAWKLMFDSGYGGTHWIASFAIFYYTDAGL